MGYSPWGRKESDMTEQLSNSGKNLQGLSPSALRGVQRGPEVGGCPHCSS